MIIVDFVVKLAESVEKTAEIAEMNAETVAGLAETFEFVEIVELAKTGLVEFSGLDEIVHFAETAGLAQTFDFVVTVEADYSAETVGYAENVVFAVLDQYKLVLRHFLQFWEEAIEMSLQL